MQIFSDIPDEQKNTAVALGYFDGVHQGHRKVISGAAGEKKNGLVPICLTFSQSPKSVISGLNTPSLMTERDKLAALKNLGIEQTIQADFFKLMNLSADEFVREILVKKLKAKKLFCGFNYRFGKNGEGDSKMLSRLCDDLGMELCIIPPAELDGEIISSTLIRELIAGGNITKANDMLGSRFGFCSEVVCGKHLGRKLGTPTLNQMLTQNLVVPKYGVYASAVTLKSGETFCGVTNIGIKPTVGGTIPMCETWMPDYHGGEIYGEEVDVRLLDFIRAEKKFESLDELRDTIMKNAAEASLIYEQQNGKE